MTKTEINYIDAKKQVKYLSKGFVRLVSSSLKEGEANYHMLTVRDRLNETLLAFGYDKANVTQIVDGFYNELPILLSKLNADSHFIFQNDPAAESIEEVLLAYPGFLAITHYRLANQLHRLGIRLLPRLLMENVHGKTGIDIHPAATIGDEFFIDHGTGIVIGATTVIGNRVKLYQGVTLGALSVSKDLASTKRHPTIEDDVVIYAGSTILGGETVIGHNSVIGGNVWLVKSVPPYSTVYHESKVVIQKVKSTST